MNIIKYDIDKRIDFSLIISSYLYMATELSGIIKICARNIINPSVNIMESSAINVDKINEMTCIASVGVIYCAIDSDDYICLTTDTSFLAFVYIDKPIGVIESSVGLVEDFTHVYVLTPGNEVGENSKIIKYEKQTGTLNLVYVETINLSTLNNAQKIDKDSEGNIYVLSDLNTATPKLTKVVYSGTWSFTTYNLV